MAAALPLAVEGAKKASARSNYLVPVAFGKDDSLTIVQLPKREIVKGRR